MPARAASGVTRRSLGIINSPDLDGGDSKRRAPCPRGSDGTSLLGLRTDGDLWTYEEGGGNEMPARAASGKAG